MKIFLVSIFTALTLALTIQAQSGGKPKDTDGKKNRRETPVNSAPKPESTDETKVDLPDVNQESSNSAINSADDEVVRVDTNLVTIPVTVFDHDGRFVADLKKEDFQVLENGKPQNIEYFATTETPFTVALVLDTSLSASLKIDEMQTAAYQFVMGLRPADRVLIVSFDEQVRVLSEPTSDRETLRRAIKQTRFGGGTSLYEAVYTTLKRMEKVNGRKAIVLFTDGVDTTSRKTNDSDNLYQAQEFEGLVYPIHYDTYEDVQAQLRNPPPILNPNPIPGSPVPVPNRTPTIPGTSIPFPTLPQQNRYPRGSNDPRYPRNPNDPRYPQDPNDPRYPQDPRDPTSPPRRSDDPTNVDPRGDDRNGGGLPGSGTTAAEYRHGKEYLDKLAANSGGRLYEANSYGGLGKAFDQIAEELRRQYSLGYYPANEGSAGERRSLAVKVNRKKISVRARDAYVVGKKTAKSKS